jgi:hypothetical protein
MKKKLSIVLAITLTLILSLSVIALGAASEPSGIIKVQSDEGKVIEIVPIIAEREGDIRVIDSQGMWTLERLGYSDLVFPCQEPHEAIQVEYVLLEDAAQGPESWYVLHLHFSIKFSEQSQVTSSFPYGRTYVSAGTNGYTCAQIKYMNEEADGHIVINWNIGSENLLGGHSSHSSTFLNIEDVCFANYLRTLGVWPGKNILTFTLTQYDGAKVESLTIFADSGIEWTFHGRERETEPWETLLTEEEEAKTLEVALSNPKVKELLEGKNYTISKFGLYRMEETITSKSRTVTRRESKVDILLNKVYEIEYNWPWPPGEQQHRTERVRELDILIDLDKGKVIGISPFPQGWSDKEGRLSPCVKLELTEEEKEKAIQIMLEDKHVQELLQGRSYSIENFGVAHEGKEMIGAGVIIRFDQIYSIDYGWPRWDYEKDERVYIHRAVPVEKMSIVVDFRSGEVREIVAWPLSPKKEAK